MYFLKLFTVSVFLIINSNNVFSAGSSSDSNNAKTKSLAYLSAEKLINKKQYSDAIVKLNDALVTDSKNADIYNYLGFSHRKIGDYSNAEIYYAMGLEIDPKHVGINEYMGELFVATNRMDEAKKRLAVLKNCNCKEYNDLKQVIEGTKQSKY